MQEPTIIDNMPKWERCATRMLDATIAALCLVVFSPLFLWCGLRIYLEDGFPVIFGQERIGYGGKVFRIYKFRTMRSDAEEKGPQLCATGQKDKRLLRCGRFMRDHHLDELPQLWNVLTGDMAFVGPRPERAWFIDQIMKHDPRYTYLYQVRPGVTSYATLYNGYADNMEKMLRRLELDLYYVGHRSMRLNLAILWRTFTRIASGSVF